MISYKYWIFYILPDAYKKFEDNIPFMIDPNTYVYAYTDTKEFADMFESIHDMRYFKRKKFDMTSEQIHELTLCERNKFMKLESYDTRFSEGVKHVDLVVTLEERYAVEESIRENIMKWSLKMPLEDPSIFAEPLREALSLLRYDRFWRYQNGCINGSPFDPWTFKLSMDELFVYTNLFGFLLKGGE